MPRPTPNDLGLLFDEWRPGQWELVQQVLGAPTKNVIVQAPPGVGKSPVGVGVARQSPHPAVYLTSTKQLQEQYRALGKMVDVRGRSNFVCATDDKLMADMGDCTFGLECGHAGKDGTFGCDYYDQARRAWHANEVVTNYSYGLRTMSHFEPRLVIMDEAHQIHSEMSSWLSLPVTRAALYYFKLQQPGGGWASFQAWGRDMKKLMPNPDLYDDKKIKRMAQLLSRVIKECSESEYEYAVLPEPWGWNLVPVWGSMSAGSTLMNWSVGKNLIMSATILDPALFCRRLGMDPASATFLDVPSPFKKERRPLRYIPTAKVGIGMTEDGLSALVEMVDKILASHPTEKGIVHTVSFKLASEVIRRTKNPGRFLTHDGKDREKVFAQFQQSTEAKVLLSPSAMVGLDAPHDGCRFQVILKLPFPDKSDPVRVAQAKSGIGKELAIYDTAASLIQAYGRAMRAEDDWGITYLLDESWGWFRKSARKFLPSWFTEAEVRIDTA